MTELIIEAGKRYNRRDGSVSGVLSERASSYYPFQDPEGYTYQRDGQYMGDDVAQPLDLLSEYTEPTAEPQDEWGPWIGWNGGECPVDGSTHVDYAFEFEGNIGAGCDDASNVRWSHDDWAGKVIAYRIKKEPVVTVFEVGFYNRDNVALWSSGYGPQNSVRVAIITLTDGNPTIEWADKGDGQ